MDYEKKYKEAEMRAEDAVNKGCLDRGLFDIIFPLEESEDEKVIRCIEHMLDCYSLFFYDKENVTKQQVYTWLEKQRKSLHVQETCKENADSFIDEPEDEKTRQEILHYFNVESLASEDEEEKEILKKWIAYLERQKEQTQDEKEYVRTLEALIADFLRGKKEVDREYYQRIWDWLENRHVEQKEQKPAWSEEDEKMRNLLIRFFDELTTAEVEYHSLQKPMIIHWLKSLRPSWKPSEEQIAILWDAISNLKHDGYKHVEELISLCEQLKKL